MIAKKRLVGRLVSDRLLRMFPDDSRVFWHSKNSLLFTVVYSLLPAGKLT
jgi:single-stranded DNA-binding protein